jgi:hypothetical protein
VPLATDPQTASSDVNHSNVTGSFISNDEDTSGVALPYRGGRLTMAALLPPASAGGSRC